MLTHIIPVLLAAALAHARPNTLTFTQVAAGKGLALDADSKQIQSSAMTEATAYATYRQKLTASFKENCERDASSNRFCPFISDPEVDPPGGGPSFEVRQTFVRALMSLDDTKTRSGACAAATETLQTILDDGTARILHSRARYWSWVCARLRNESTEAWRDALWTHHPLSGLTFDALRADRDPRLDETIEDPSPEWALRTRVSGDEEVNQILRGIEALLRLKEGGAAAVVLKRIQSRFADAEPALRLYVGALAARTSALVPNTAPAFRILEPLLTEHREYMRRPTLEALYPRPPAYFDELLAARGSLDAGLFAGMVHQESSMYPRSRSRVAFGLTQMRPETADDVNARLRLSPSTKLEGTDLFDPRLSLGLGAEYLSQMLTKFNQDPRLALAAYHSGDDRLRKWLAVSPKINDPLIRSHVLYLNATGATSTAVYVINVLGRAAWYRALYGEELNER